MNKRRGVFYLDLLERVLVTFVQGFAAFWVVTGSFDREALYAGLVAGTLSAAKALAASLVGDGNSAALLPSPPDFADDVL